MPRRKIHRTPEEEEELKRAKQARILENRIRNRSNLRDRTVLNDQTKNTTIFTEVLERNLMTNHDLNTVPNNNINELDRVRQQEHRARQRRFRNVFNNQDENLDNRHEHYIGMMDLLCIHCNAKHFAAEKIANKGLSFSNCCGHGIVNLEPLPDPPIKLRSLFDGTHPRSAQFYERIRSYNSSFSFASFNANLVNFSGNRPGPYCFKIQGQIYYQMNTALYPAPNEYPSNGQLFIIDSNEAAEYRMGKNSSLDREILEILERLMREHNIFAKSYQMMGDELQVQQRRASQINDLQPDELQLLFTLRPGMDRRRYNIQRSNEVAAVFSLTADGEIPESYVTIRDKNTKKLQFVSSMDPNVEPWIYPIFYPFGTQGWHRNLMTTNNAKRVTRAAYIKHRMAIRDNENLNTILMGRRLFQQWVVDSYVKIERDRIEFLKSNQKKLRAETYHGLVDYLQRTANNANARIGKMIVLPSTFVGSPRNMMQHYQDAMGIVRKYGKPDLFITMTCNPQWREIKENLFENQQPSDRPDICVRVFNIKKDYLIDLIVRQQIFGEVQAYVYVVEFQKRGLPHVHMLVTLKPNSKITTPEAVDRYISAEIPDSEKDPILHTIVMKNMIHGPCGDWCMVDQKCSKHFPKTFNEETTMDANGYPFYRRSNTGITYERPGGYVVDNRHVVPYCSQLSIIFSCHINVEVVSSIKSVKYLFKYVYKGHDAAAVIIGECTSEATINHDEIQDHIEARYVGPAEASWRIFSYHLQQKSHAIIRLPVHLPNEQSITIENELDEDIVRSALNRVTMLIDYFELNARDELARDYVYPEIPCHYVFKSIKINGINISRWERRKANFKIIGRMYSISPTQTELYHLRLLLLTVKGATSFENLRTVNGECKETFTATALALGLIEDDDEWKRAMQEAALWMMPNSLRRMFVRILINCQPVYPEKLWEEFKIVLSEDYARHIGLVPGQKKAYARITEMLCTEGWNIAQFPSMIQLTEVLDENDGIQPCQSLEIGMQYYEQLNKKQKDIVDKVLEAVDTDNQENIETCIYIDGPGGSGKTFVYTTLTHLIKGRKRCVSTMAFTGIAATLLPNGKTVHKTFGLPVPLYADSSSSIKVQSKEGEYLKQVDVFIWDEAPMAPRYALEIMDRTLKDIMNNFKPFGGKIVILGGDFRQLLPIKVGGTRNETINLSIKYSTVWKNFKKIELTEDMRVLPEEVEFNEFLLEVGNGIKNDFDSNLEIPERCIAAINQDIVEETYGQLIREHRYKDTAKCAILSARNIDVEDINKKVIDLLDRKSERIYTSVDNVENSSNTEKINEVILPEYLNTLGPSGLPPHELHLRKYCIVMLIRNLSINEGLCNGTRLMVLDLGNNVLRCEILTGDRTGNVVFINRITLYCENVYPFTFKRRQLPIKIAYAMTINKAQGQTFNKIGIDLRKDVFNHGQLYVAFSRVRSWDSLKIYLGIQRKNNKVKNYVYKELYL